MKDHTKEWQKWCKENAVEWIGDTIDVTPNFRRQSLSDFETGLTKDERYLINKMMHDHMNKEPKQIESKGLIC